MPTKSWIEVPIDQEVEGVPTTGYAPIFFPVEGGVALFRYTQDEFLQVLSALINGAALTYPNEWIQVVWYFLRSVEFPVSICEQIIACVTNDTDVQNAIASMLTTNQVFNQWINTKVDTLKGSQITTKLIAGDCDRPVLAGKIKNIVDGMNQANIDWFELIETGTNSEEKFAYVWSAIPGIGELPVDEAVDFAQDILEDFAEQYAGQVDAELLQEWYCGLLCVAEKNADCSLTYGEIYQYFADRIGSGLNPFSALTDVTNFIVFGEFSTGSRIADATMALQTGLVVNGMEFMGSNLPSIAFLARDADTATYYEDCEVCPEDDLWLSPVLAGEDTIEQVSFDEDSQVWLLHNYYTGNYLTGGAFSSNGTPFYILDVDVSGTPGGDARFVLDYGTKELDATNCYLPTTKIWLYNVIAGADVTVTIARLPCIEVYVVGRTDGGFAGVVTTCVLVGATATGGSIYDVTSDAVSGPIGIGVNTVEEDLTTLKSAYLVSAVSMTPGSVISYHYHEQAESIGDGTGASGTVSSKKWSFFGLSSYGQTVRLTYEANPY